MGAIQGRFVPTVAVSLSLFMWTRAEVATESPLRLPLYVYDYAGVGPDVRAAAAEITEHIYAAIGVDIVWVDRCPLACHIAFTREAQAETTGGDLMVIILPDAMTPEDFPAGVMGHAPEEGSVAYAFFGRIRFFALHRDLLQATLLGHVVAHEVGHVLLREGHAPHGLMSARWVDAELLQAKLGRLGFTETQGSRIRSRLGSGAGPTESGDARAR
jgi:hypothetical protein